MLPGRVLTAGTPDMVGASTHPVDMSAATSCLSATSSSPLKPWVTLPTLQFAWSSGAVLNVASTAFIQKTHPAGTRPVRPSSVARGMDSANESTPSIGSAVNVIAIGGTDRLSASVRPWANLAQSLLVMSGSPVFGGTPRPVADESHVTLRAPRPARHVSPGRSRGTPADRNPP